MARIRIALSFDLPDGATREEALTYAVDAVATMKGALHPYDDPMFNLDSRTLEGTTVVTRKGKRIRLRCSGDD